MKTLWPRIDIAPERLNDAKKVTYFICVTWNAMKQVKKNMAPGLPCFEELNRFMQKTLTVSQSTFEIKAVSPWALFEILLTSAVISKQRLLLQNCKYHDVNQGHFRKPYKVLLTPWKTITLFFMGYSIFSYFLDLNCNFSHCFDKINQTTFFRKCNLNLSKHAKIIYSTTQ